MPHVSYHIMQDKNIIPETFINKLHGSDYCHIKQWTPATIKNNQAYTHTQSTACYITVSSLSLRSNGHLPGEPGLARCSLKQRMMEAVVTTGAISCAKLQSNHHHQQTNISFFTGQMPFLSPNQQCHSTEGKNITFHGLAYPKLTRGLPTLSLTTNSSW